MKKRQKWSRTWIVHKIVMVGFGKYLLSGKFGMEYISYSEGGRYYERSEEKILRIGAKRMSHL